MPNWQGSRQRGRFTLITANGDRWTLRSVQGATEKLWYVYRNGSRVNRDGSFETSVSFSSLTAAKSYVEEVSHV